MPIVCSARIYQYKGFTFELAYHGIYKLKRNYELAKTTGIKFWKAIDEFQKLSDEKQKEYRVRGGCQIW